jgi:hypothetical protein
LETLARREPLTGLATNAPVYVTHGIVLRTEFRPEAGGRGPIVDLVAKIFPKGSSTFPGLIIGMPALDVAPYGLGFRVCKATYALDTLGIQVPRLDLDRRDALNVCNRVTSATEDEVEAA